MTPKGRRLAIACSAGGYRTVFIQGVLAALEEAGIRAAAYGASSASVTSAALAAGGDARAASLAYAQESPAREGAPQPGHERSEPDDHPRLAAAGPRAAVS